MNYHPGDQLLAMYARGTKDIRSSKQDAATDFQGPDCLRNNGGGKKLSVGSVTVNRWVTHSKSHVEPYERWRTIYRLNAYETQAYK